MAPLHGPSGGAGPSGALPAAIKRVEGDLFQMASTLSQLKKLVDVLGTPKDTVEHRHKIAATNTKMQVRAESWLVFNCYVSFLHE